MKSHLLDVYGRWPMEIVQGEGCRVQDSEGQSYLDLYGGHAVVSIGHGHPHYESRLRGQLSRLGFYSNAVHLPIQEEAAQILIRSSGYADAKVFFCNSGAEATENALKVASFATGRAKVLCFTGGFHGRTSLAVACTDNPAVQAPVNHNSGVFRIEWDHLDDLEQAFEQHDFAAVLVEPVQGIGGCRVASKEFLEAVVQGARANGALVVFDEIQAGCGRTGSYFAHQAIGGADFRGDIVTLAKGIGNGFPVGAVLVQDSQTVKRGQLGTTFGGNPLACAAVLGVHEVIEKESLVSRAKELGVWLRKQLEFLPGVQSVRGKGLMLGVNFAEDTSSLRRQLVMDHKIFVGSAAAPECLRILPPLTVEKADLEMFISAFKDVLKDK